VGIGDWGLGIGDWGVGPSPNPQSPKSNPNNFFYINLILLNANNQNYNNINI